VACTRTTCDGCDVPTKDHFQPRGINKVWKKEGYEMENVNREENLIYLSWPCHQIKDESTPSRVDMLRDMLKRGSEVTLEDYRREILSRYGVEVDVND